MKQRADILKCDISDIAEIAGLEEKHIPDGWSEKAFSDCFSNENTVIFKAVSGGKIIGFVNGSWVIDEGELLNIAVSENFRRCGTASALLNALENFFMENGVEKIFLEVREKNSGAVSFYLKHGFEKNGLRKNYYRNPPDNAILMMKKYKLL
ncbi:MAG: ribosomal protein S18-alanine N-acetyltransferase [Porcipelethomonas sp.]